MQEKTAHSAPHQISDVFLEAYKIYPGTKSRTNDWKTFRKHKDWKYALPLLKPAIEEEIKHKRTLKESGADFIPQWKHFKTWLNQRCWEQELSQIDNGADTYWYLKDE